MTDLEFRSDMSVELVDSMGSDASVVRAARVSTGKDLTGPAAYDKDIKLIWYLMKNRHGTPFEAAAFQFRVECPLFTAREFMRHRIASYNEVSGRYSELKPVFWIPSPARGLVQEGKPGEYVMKPGTLYQYERQVTRNKLTAEWAYKEYQDALEDGICREVARTVLPLSLYTSFYVTMNARSLMNFLSLRVDDPDAAYPSKPQYEIESVAILMEDFFYRKMPLTYTAFKENKRVAP